MRIGDLAQVFGFPELDDIISRQLKVTPGADIQAAEVVEALCKEQEGLHLPEFFKKCIEQSLASPNEFRADDYAEGALWSFKKLETSSNHDELKTQLAPLLKKAEKYNAIFESMFPEKKEPVEANSAVCSTAILQRLGLRPNLASQSALGVQVQAEASGALEKTAPGVKIITVPEKDRMMTVLKERFPELEPKVL